MAASSSQSQQNTKDLLIYVFYDVDSEDIFAGKHIPRLANSSDMFPRIDEKDFISKFDFFIQRPGESSKKFKLNMVQFRSWITDKNSAIIRHDVSNNVDVVYIWSNFITNHEDPVYVKLMNFLKNRGSDQSSDAKTFVYMVKFCQNVPYFRDHDGFVTLQNLVDAPDDNDIDLFRNHKNQIMLHVFVDNYFKNTGYNDGESVQVLNRFLEKLNIRDVNDTNPCFIVRPGDINIDVLNISSVNKYTDFMFLQFETYMSDIYSDYRVKTLTYPLEAASIQIYRERFIELRAKLTDYERRINEFARLLREKNIETNAYRDAINNLTDELEEKRLKIEELEESSKRPTTLQGDLLEQISILQHKIRELKSKIRGLEIELRSEQLENERLEGNIASRDFVIKHHLKTIAESGSSPELLELKDMYNTLVREYNDYKTQSEERIQALEYENMRLRNSEGACSVVVRELREELDRYKMGESSQESSFELVTSEQVEETFGGFGDISVISEEQELPGQIMSPESSSSEVEILEDKLENLERQEIIKTDEIEAKQIASSEIRDQIAQMTLSLNTVQNEDERNRILIDIQKLRNILSDQQEDIAHTRFELYNEITRPKEEVEEKLAEAVEKRVEEGEESTILLPLELELEESSQSFISPEETEITFKHREEATSTPPPTLQITSSQMNNLFTMSLSTNSYIFSTQSKILLENVHNTNNMNVSLGLKKSRPAPISTTSRFFVSDDFLNYLDS